MRRILLLAALGLAGCRGDAPPPMAGTPESTRTTLTTALDGWKAGKGAKDLAAGSPRVYVVDDDLNRGTPLLDYKIEGDGQPLGVGYIYVVSLTFQGKGPRKVAYTVVTTPNHAVTREERQP